MQTQVISFYSDVDNRTYYSDHAVRLKQQLDELGIPYDIREKQSLGSYQKNCLSKPDFIYKLLVDKRAPVLWLDIDSNVLKSLSIFDSFIGNTDMAFASGCDRLICAKASPIYFDFNANVLEFLQHWTSKARDAASAEMWFDHEALMDLLMDYYKNKNLRLKFLGPEYCTWPGKVTHNTVIEMGLADAPSKKETLRKMGISESSIEWQSPGTK